MRRRRRPAPWPTSRHDAEPMVTFDPDAIFDYRSRRPVLDVQDGRLSDLRWPELAIRHVPVDGRDLLIFSGAEPDLRWQELASDVAALVASLGVALWVSLGAVPGAVAHTMPVPVMATASQDGLLGPRTPPGPEGLLRVPSAALSALEMAVSEIRHPRHRILRAGAAIRQHRLHSRQHRAARAARPPPRGRPADGRPARRGARAASPLRRGRGQRRHAAPDRRAAGVGGRRHGGASPAVRRRAGARDRAVPAA